jgi:hypothetical protein
MSRTVTVTVAVLAAATVAAPAALATHAKPVKKSYEATAPMPDPTNWGLGDYSVCAQNVPESYHVEEFKAPSAGKLRIELTDYEGDWDLLLMDGKAREMAFSGSGEVGEPEIVQVKLKKPQTVQIVACNWAGGPTGTVTYTFTDSVPKK